VLKAVHALAGQARPPCARAAPTAGVSAGSSGLEAVAPTSFGRPDVERFLLRLVHDRKVSPSTHNVNVGALEFLYDVAEVRPEVMASMLGRKQSMRVVLPSTT
jgi:hypothetical protein